MAFGQLRFLPIVALFLALSVLSACGSGPVYPPPPPMGGQPPYGYAGSCGAGFPTGNPAYPCYPPAGAPGSVGWGGPYGGSGGVHWGGGHGGVTVTGPRGGGVAVGW